ncbi:GNAT family N-acetyltransferase [Sanguibacter sp. 25GB23B1]|uniref:GNAT family N-acetyltransferase n=1 Tax=unclassified Sanguibacter TaxID=2645534 RepID=UPI0032AFDE10
MYTITPAAPADVLSAAEVLAQAFEGDPVMAAVTGRPAPAAALLARLFAPLLRSGPLPLGGVDLARRSDDGSIAGVAVWEPPGSRSHLLRQAVEVPAFLAALGLRGLSRALHTQGLLARHRPAARHWYLAQIGATAAARGTGVGSALLEARLARVDAEGAAAYLESSNERNRRLYARAGFRETAPIAGIDGARPMGMWRAPVTP